MYALENTASYQLQSLRTIWRVPNADELLDPIIILVVSLNIYMSHEGEERDPSYSFGTSTVALKCVKSLKPCFNPCAPTDVAFSQRRQ